MMPLTEKTIDKDIERIKESMANIQTRINQLSQDMVGAQQSLIGFKGQLQYALEIKNKLKKGVIDDK